MTEITIRVSTEALREASTALLGRVHEYKRIAAEPLLDDDARRVWEEWAAKADSAYRELIAASVNTLSPETTDAVSKYHAQDPLERHERGRVSFQGEKL